MRMVIFTEAVQSAAKKTTTTNALSAKEVREQWPQNRFVQHSEPVLCMFLFFFTFDEAVGPWLPNLGDWWLEKVYMTHKWFCWRMLSQMTQTVWILCRGKGGVPSSSRLIRHIEACVTKHSSPRDGSNDMTENSCLFRLLALASVKRLWGWGGTG